jgi:HNH endonuclease
MTPDEITQDFLKKHFFYDPLTGHIMRLRNGKPYGCKMKAGYILGQIGGRNGPFVYAHRLAWRYMTGHWPKILIDHKNGIKDDNRWDNLREANHSQNHLNSKNRKSASGHRGVYWHSKNGKWQVRVTIDGKMRSCGYYVELCDAIEKHQSVYKALCGEWFRAAA